jgi:hypothetical protein
MSITVSELEKIMNYKNIYNFELVKGDILKTLPEYVERNPQLKISLLHLDTDIYEPSKIILEILYDKVVRGGVIVLDDYGTFAGETKAVDDFFADKEVHIQKFPFSQSTPSYIIKNKRFLVSDPFNLTEVCKK